jgi:uncharacterized damage-inducible protein DinB
MTLACCAVLATGLAAQGMGQGQAMGQGAGAGMGRAGGEPVSLVTEVQRQFMSVSSNITRAADAFPEDKYTWAPTIPAQPDNQPIRTWAQLVAHMTDDARNNCWTLSGETGDRPAGIERGQPGPNSMSKADLTAAIKSAMDTCTKAFANVTPENMTQPSGGRGNASKLGQLVAYVAHANEHYGNMVTYMRLAGLVPPSSQGRGGMPGRGGARAGGMGGAMPNRGN